MNADRDQLPAAARRALDELRRLDPPPDLVRAVMREAEATQQRRPPLFATFRFAGYASALAAVAIILAIAMPIAAPSPGASPASPTPTESDVPSAGAVELRVAVPDGAHTGSADAGGVWLGQESTGVVLKLDPESGAELGRVEVNAPTREPYDLWPVTDGTSVWVAGREDQALVRIDAGSLEVVDRWPIDAVPYRIQPGDRAVWVSDFDEGRVLKVDPTDGQVLASAPVSRATGIALTTDAVYVVGYGGSLVEIDPETAEIRENYVVAAKATDLVAIDGDLLIWGIDGRILERFDLETRRVAATTRGVTAVAVLDNQPWATTSDGAVARLDPGTLAAVGAVSLGDVGTDQLVASADRLWAYASTPGGTAIYVVRPRPGVHAAE